MITNLPIHAVLDAVTDALCERDEAILEAPPGAGKTTIIPLHLLEAAWLGDNRILMLEPRRIATRNAAHRMAELLNETVGQRVGYRMRLESRVGPQTRIEVITEGIFTRMLMDDPGLTGVGLVIFDEFHERSLDADLGLALLLKSREIFRDQPLKCLVMSATLESDRLSRLLNDAPVVTSAGKLWPVEAIYGQPAKPRERITDRMEPVILQALADNPGSSVLAFLPGEGEIRGLASSLGRRVGSDTSIHPLFGNLSLQQQRAAIAPVTDGEKRKLVLATNIAETSLTIDGVHVVVDSGLERRAVFDPNTAMTRLQTFKISQASAIQRAGRAGRLGPGKCYRLWSAEQQQQLHPYIEPEIVNADLSPVVLQLLSWGLSEAGDVDWLDAPSPGAWQQAKDLLDQLGAIDQSGQAAMLSAHGEQMASLSVPPRLAHLLLCSAAANASKIGCALASLLSDRDPLQRQESVSAEIEDRLDILLHRVPCPPQLRGWQTRATQLSQQFEKQLDRQKIHPHVDLPPEDVTAYLVACAYPDRVARKRHSGGFQLANGRSASLRGQDSIAKNRWLAVAEVGGVSKREGDVIRTATGLNPELFESALAPLKSVVSKISWDKKTGRLVAEEQTLIGRLVLKRADLQTITEAQKASAICDHVRDVGLGLFKSYRDFDDWRARVRLLHEQDPESWPDLDDAPLLASLEDWLAPYVINISKLEDLKKIQLKQIHWDRLGHAAQRTLDKLAPERFEVPTGSMIRIDYSQHPPVLAVKLQEMFGCDETPRIVNGQIALVVHLLSPAGRPLQITQDLAGFWRSSYQAVRKDMKGRYPKHPWPEDPTQAAATRYTKRS